MIYLYCIAVMVVGAVLIFAVGGVLAAGVGGALLGHGLVLAAISGGRS